MYIMTLSRIRCQFPSMLALVMLRCYLLSSIILGLSKSSCKFWQHTKLVYCAHQAVSIGRLLLVLPAAVHIQSLVVVGVINSAALTGHCSFMVFIRLTRSLCLFIFIGAVNSVCGLNCSRRSLASPPRIIAQACSSVIRCQPVSSSAVQPGVVKHGSASCSKPYLKVFFPSVQLLYCS